MLLLKAEEQKQLRILTVIVIIAGILYLFFAPKNLPLNQTIMEGKNQLLISLNSNNEIDSIEIKQKGETTPDKVFINESSLEALLCCPGIGKTKAAAIIEERQKRKFLDWRDFQNRIKGISAIQIQILKDAGVRLESSENLTQDL